MDPESALGELVRVEAEIARLHAVQAALLVAVADPVPRVEEYRVWDPRPGHEAERVVRIEDAVREEVAAALRWSPATAQARIDAATRASPRWSRTWTPSPPTPSTPPSRQPPTRTGVRVPGGTLAAPVSGARTP